MVRSIIALAFTALATSAIAADLPVRPPPPAPAPVYLWTGCYIGGNVGWAQVSAHFNDRNDGNDGNLSSSAFAGGGQIGCDYQFASNWVIGIQGLIDWTDIKRDRVSIIDPDVSPRGQLVCNGHGPTRLPVHADIPVLRQGRMGLCQ